MRDMTRKEAIEYRRSLRRNTFILLFISDFHTKEDINRQIRMYFKELEPPLEDEDKEKIERKLQGVLQHKDEIDQKIKDNSEGWNISRIGKVELAIIRLACYEIFYDKNISTKIAINEAVELAKVYGQGSGGAFVNGILAKMVRPEETQAGIGETKV